MVPKNRRKGQNPLIMPSSVNDGIFVLHNKVEIATQDGSTPLNCEDTSESRQVLARVFTEQALLVRESISGNFNKEAKAALFLASRSGFFLAHLQKEDFKKKGGDVEQDDLSREYLQIIEQYVDFSAAGVKKRKEADSLRQQLVSLYTHSVLYAQGGLQGEFDKNTKAHLFRAFDIGLIIDRTQRAHEKSKKDFIRKIGFGS